MSLIFYSIQAKQLVEKSPQKALVPYTQLMQLAHKIKYKNEQVGHSVKNLDAFLQQSVDALWDDMKSRLSKCVFICLLFLLKKNSTFIIT